MSYLRKYLPDHVERQMAELFASSTIMDFALATVSLLEPVFLFQNGFSIPQILFFNSAIYVLYVVLMPLGGKVAIRWGFELAMFFSMPFLIGYYASLYAVQTSHWFVVPAVICLALQKMLYWPGYNGDFAMYSGGSDAGRELGSRLALSSLVYVLGPLFGGFVAYTWGFSVLFLIVCLLFFLSALPMLLTQEKFAPGKFSYRAFLRFAFAPENRRSFFAYLGFGEELIVLVIWPIFIYHVVNNFLGFGALVSASTALTTVTMLYVGRWVDRERKQNIVRIGTYIYAFTWALRLLATSGLQVLFIDTLSRVSKNTLYIPLLSLTFERARERQHILKSVIFYEWGLAIGKIIAAGVAALLFFIFPGFETGFIIAGLMTWLYLLI